MIVNAVLYSRENIINDTIKNTGKVSNNAEVDICTTFVLGRTLNLTNKGASNANKFLDNKNIRRERRLT